MLVSVPGVGWKKVTDVISTTTWGRDVIAIVRLEDGRRAALFAKYGRDDWSVLLVRAGA